MAERFVSNPKVLDLARRYIGTVEVPVNRTIFGEWFGWNGVAWCAIWISFIHWFGGAKVPPIQTAKGGAYVPTFVEHAKRTGQWRPASSGYIPKPLDHVVFWFTTRPDHIALVEMVHGRNDIGTIEGNTNAAGSRTGGMVARLRRRTRIHGYIEVDVPTQGGIDLVALRKWLAGVALSKLQGVRTPLQRGDSGEDVKTLQESLNIAKNAKLTVDGDYGPATLMHVADWQNSCRKLGLPINDAVGVFGDTTKWWLCVHLQNITEGRA